MSFAYYQIDRLALQKNLARVRALAPQRKVLAMVKANGYGHGLLEVADALKSAEGFGVARLGEAIALREAGFKDQVIVLMEGFLDAEALALCAALQISPSIHAMYQVEILSQMTLSSPLTVWLKIDTGMHRLGFLPEDFSAAYARLLALNVVQKPLTFFTHFAHAGTPSHPENLHQRRCFERLTQDLPGEKSLANSGAILSHPESHGDWVRPGIMLYGVSPLEGLTGPDLGLVPVMSFFAPLISLKRLPEGACVGYGGRYTCPEPMWTGLVGAGYADGYPRHAPSGTWIKNKASVVPLIGTVSMDYLSVDLRQCPEARVGDNLCLWGEGLPIEKLADVSGTIGYEILTGVTARPRRSFLP